MSVSFSCFLYYITKGPKNKTACALTNALGRDVYQKQLKVWSHLPKFCGAKNVNCLLPISVVMYEAQHQQKTFLDQAANYLDQTEPFAKSEISSWRNFYWNDWISPVKFRRTAVNVHSTYTFLYVFYALLQEVEFTWQTKIDKIIFSEIILNLSACCVYIHLGIKLNLVTKFGLVSNFVLKIFGLLLEHKTLRTKRNRQILPFQHTFG